MFMNRNIVIHFAVFVVLSIGMTICEPSTEFESSVVTIDQRGDTKQSCSRWEPKAMILDENFSNKRAPKSEILNKVVHGKRLSPLFEKELNYAVDEYVIATAEKRLKDRSNDVYMIDSTTGEELKLLDFIQKSRTLAAELQSLGCDKNTIVGIISENRVEVPIVILATLLTGAAFTGYTPNYSYEELKLVYNIVKPTIIFCSAEYCDKLRNKIAPATTKFIVFDSENSPSGIVKFSEFLHSGYTKELRKVENKPNDIACISYSSGTTGLPKGVTFTHRNFMYSIIWIRESIMNNGPKTIVLTPIGIYTTGFMPCLAAVVRNETIISTRKPDMVSFLSAIQKYQVKRLLIYTGIMTFLLKDPLVNQYNLSSVETVYCGGAPMAGDTEKAFIEKFKLKQFIQVYGLTETPWITIKHPESPKLGTCGAPSLGLEVKIVDQETGNILGVEQFGELYVRGPNVVKGYYNNEEATAITIDQEGWFHTGDIAYYDTDGDFYIVGRSKELIKVGSWPVPPAELEALLLDHPSIAEAAVIGIPDDYYGEVPRGYVVTREGKTVTERELVQYIAGKVVECKSLKGGVEFISKVPRNGNGKIIRNELKKLWEEHNKQNKTK